MIKYYLLKTFSILLLTSFCLGYSSTEFKIKAYIIVIKVVNIQGIPLQDISVYLEDGYSCIEDVTNNEGKVEFELNAIPTMIYLSDTRNKPKYGIKVYVPNMSAYEYIIEMPSFPKNEGEAIFQLNNFTNVVSEGYGYYSAIDFIRKGLGGGLSSHGLGVPGVFSINPIPVVDNEGRLGLRLSGILVDNILKMYVDMQNKITGINFDYYYDPNIGF